MANGPKLWMKLISEAPKNSVLMGGAVVDYAYSVHLQPKDYDIFYTYQVGLPVLPPNWVKLDQDNQNEYEQGNGNHIGSVYDYLVDGVYRIQLIGVHFIDPKQHFKSFDHSLTLGVFSNKGMFIHRKAFESVQNETIEYISKNKEPKAVAKSLARAQKKADKYGWLNPQFKGFDLAFNIEPAGENLF